MIVETTMIGHQRSTLGSRVAEHGIRGRVFVDPAAGLPVGGSQVGQDPLVRDAVELLEETSEWLSLSLCRSRDMRLTARS